MQAFYYENNTNMKTDTRGWILAGQLDLPPGGYAAWAKLSVGCSVASGITPPEWPYHSGVAALAYADRADQAYVGLKPENALNHTTINLMTVGKSNIARKVWLYYLNLYPLRVFLSSVRITALQVEIANQQIIGEGTEDFEDPTEKQREAILNARLRDLSPLLPHNHG